MARDWVKSIKANLIGRKRQSMCEVLGIALVQVTFFLGGQEYFVKFRLVTGNVILWGKA